MAGTRTTSVAASLLMTVAVAGCAKSMGGEDEGKVEIESVPAVVRTAIERESGGATIKEIERERENGRLVYEAEFVRDGQEWEVTVAPDGTVLGKEQEGAEDKDDDAEDDDGGKDDKD